MAEIASDRIVLASKQKWSPRKLLMDLIEEEASFRREKAVRSRIRRASLVESWTLETFPFDLQPGVDQAQIMDLADLADLDFVRKGINIVFIGKPGVGKTGLASSLLLKALLDGSLGLTQRMQDLLDDLLRSIADRTTKNLMNRLSRLDVLLADEMGYLCLNKDQSNLFFKLMDNRYLAKKSTIITTNSGFDDWGNFFSDPVMTAALLSRLKHRCIVIQIDGPDLRDPNLGISGALASRSP